MIPQAQFIFASPQSSLAEKPDHGTLALLGLGKLRHQRLHPTNNLGRLDGNAAMRVSIHLNLPQLFIVLGDTTNRQPVAVDSIFVLESDFACLCEPEMEKGP